VKQDSCEQLEAIKDPFDACWAATSWTVNASDDDTINEIVRCFNSPAPQVYFALQRALYLADAADREEILQIFSYMLKIGHRFVIGRRDAETPVAEWRIVPSDASLEKGWQFLDPIESFPNTLGIAHHLLDMVTEASENHCIIDPSKIDHLVDLALHRLRLSLGTDIRGRISSDAAFCFAMAGVTRPEIYEVLATISKQELNRIGRRPSFPSKSILQIVEKLAAAGIQGPEVEQVYHLAAELLALKGEHDDIVVSLRGTGKEAFGLHSTRPLLWLWRFAARQTKAKVPQKGPADSASDGQTVAFDKLEDFEDSSRPLIVDVGSGMGVSLLGLASNKDLYSSSSSGPLSENDYNQCNFVGGDLSQILTGYSRGIALRWGVARRTQFVWKPADALLQDVKSYPGKVAMIMIQFPTPFRLPKKTDGNPQLPSDASSGFMVSLDLLQSASGILQHSGGYLLLQSNCEDVAVVMRDMAVNQVGMMCVDAEFPVTRLGVGSHLPQRTCEWIAMGGERPVGPSWSAKPLLPRQCQTETEVACELQGTPVHRCLLWAGPMANNDGV
jgi:hypothetical protein